MAAHFNVKFLTLPLKCICRKIAITLQSHPLLQFKYIFHFPLAFVIAAKCYEALNTQLTFKWFSVQSPARELLSISKWKKAWRPRTRIVHDCLTTVDFPAPIGSLSGKGAKCELQTCRDLFMSSYLFNCPCDPGINYTWNVQGLLHELIAIKQSIFTQVLHWMAELRHIIFLWSHRLPSFKL